MKEQQCPFLFWQCFPLCWIKEGNSYFYLLTIQKALLVLALVKSGNNHICNSYSISQLLKHISWHPPRFSQHYKHKTQFSNDIHQTSDSSCKAKQSPQNSSICAQNQTMLSDHTPSQSKLKTLLSSHYTLHKKMENTMLRTWSCRNNVYCSQ